MAKEPSSDISIGKFDILATYTYAQALLHGLKDDEAKQRGMVAAIMGAQARLGVRKEHHEEFQAQKEAPLKRRKRLRSPPSRSTSRSPTRWASSSTKSSCRP
jgi:hypothetical protein